MEEKQKSLFQVRQKRIPVLAFSREDAMKKPVHLLIIIFSLLLFCSSAFAEDNLEVGEVVEFSVKDLGSFSIAIDGVGRYAHGDQNGMACISVRCVIENHDASVQDYGYLPSYKVGEDCLSVLDEDGFACAFFYLSTSRSDKNYEINPDVKIGQKKRAGILYFLPPESDSITVKVGRNHQISFTKNGNLFTPVKSGKNDDETESSVTEAGSDSISKTDPASESNARADGAAGPDSGSGSDADTSSDTDSGSGPDTGSDTDSGSDADTGSGSETASASVSVGNDGDEGEDHRIIEELKTRLEALEKRETQLESEVQALMDEAAALQQDAETEAVHSSGMSDGPAGLTDEEQILQAAVSAYWHLFSFAEDPRSIRIISMCTYKDSIIIDSIGKEFDGTYVRYLHQYFADTDTLESLGRPDRVSDEYKIGSKKTAPVDSARILAFSKSDRCRGYYISSGVFITEEEAEALQKGLIAEDTAGSTK